MTDTELDAALDESYTYVLEMFNNPGFVKLFNDHVALSIKHKELQDHWWVKLGKFLRLCPVNY